ncbi:MAG: hypothetical protein ACKVP3_05160 [Hyphomicrobiaceae bacterium]
MTRQVASEQSPERIVYENVRHSGDRITALVSMSALLFSLYSLWDTSLKWPDVRVFVPPVIHYSAPYQNSNFEMIAVPVTLTNEGARTGTVLSINLEVTDIKTGEVKRFYAADIGRWSMDRTRTMAYQSFAPLSLSGRSSRTEPILFYTRGDEEKPPQLIDEVGDYKFKLTLDLAEVNDLGWFDRLWQSPEPSVTFERTLRVYDARAFNTGTLPMYAKDWQASANAK